MTHHAVPGYGMTRLQASRRRDRFTFGLGVYVAALCVWIMVDSPGVLRWVFGVGLCVVVVLLILVGKNIAYWNRRITESALTR